MGGRSEEALITLPAVACIVLTAVLVWGEYAKNDPVRIVAKTGAAWAFIIHGLLVGVADAGPHGRLVLVGLGLSMVGDVLLLSRQTRYFLAGLVAFLLAHVAYVGAFIALGVSWVAVALAAVAVGSFAWRVWQWLKDDVGGLGPAVVAYILVIASMVACAAGSAALGGWGRWGLLLAAITFFVSDLCVARDRFVAPGWDNRLVGLPLYFVSQLMFGTFVVLA